MDDIVERMRALVAQDEASDAANLERSRVLRLRRSWLRWLLRRTLAPAVH